jgi:DNA-binding LytR/AlgR family response regulator
MSREECSMVEKGYIVVIDDDVEFLKLFKKLLIEYLGFDENEILTFTEYNKEKLSKIKIDLVFLDIELATSMDGIDVAKELNKSPDKPLLFFCSNKTQRMHDTFLVEPLHFVRKTHLDKDIAMVDYMLQKARFRHVTNVSINNVTVNVNNIMYIKSLDHYIQLFYKDGSVKKIYCTLSKAEILLEPFYFKKIHKSYIVNFAFVEDVAFKNVYLKNETILKTGRKYTEEIEKYFEKWCLHYA